MISLEEAQHRTREAVTPAAPVDVAVGSALGLFLAAPLQAPRPVPSCDNSAMDGFAVLARETVGATRDTPVRLRLIGTSAAGATTALCVAPGKAVRVFTGAPLPEGADTIIRQEAAHAEGDQVELYVESPSGKNIRRRGEELATGALVAAAGTRANPHVLALAASFGFSTVRVRPAPRMALVVVGDELVFPGQPAAEHQVYESNSVLLSGLATSAGAVTTGVFSARDDDAQLLDALEQAAVVADVIVTSGGASVGDRDRVKHVLTKAGGKWRFDRVALKPGLPAALATWSDRPVFVLPGNPGAATIAFDQLVRPALFRLQGVHEEREVLRVPLETDLHKHAHLTQVMAARLVPGDEGLRLWIRPQGAGQLFQNVDADGWVVLPAHQADFPRGTQVRFEAFHRPRYREDT